MTRSTIALCFAWGLLPAAATAAPLIDIPSQPLRSGVVALGVIGHATVGIDDSSLGAIIGNRVSGAKDVRQALRRITKGTPATFVEIDQDTFRIVRRTIVALKGTASAALTGAELTTHGQDVPIVVSASKRSAATLDYPGSVVEVDLNALSDDARLRGSDALVERTPILTSTHLGPGRDKLFIRGIADSSFNGPTQATVGQYLGEVRLTYSAPDPNLAIIDMSKVEVLEGPQGTLYGAGTVGGVIRLEPNGPDLDRWSGSVFVGLASTAHGGPSVDGSAVVNVPLANDRLALRMLAYGALSGGYIDDPSRRRSNINLTVTRGGRATLRFRPASDWTIDLGAVVQDINSRDGQYALKELPPLKRTSVIAQPFDNDYALGSLVMRHDIGDSTLTSATSIVSHDVNSTYDASPSSTVPIRYQEDHKILLLAHETRLSHRSIAGGGWTVGFELLRSADDLHRNEGPPTIVAPLPGTSNIAEEGSAYGEGTLHLGRRWFLSGGARIDVLREVGRVLDRSERDDQHRTTASVLPSAGVLWKSSDVLSLYARYQEGFRPGGLSVQSAGALRFAADSVASWEGGVRLGRAGGPLSGTAAVSYAHWEDIQADLVDMNGLPYTANIGSSRVLGLEMQGRWRPARHLTIDSALFLNDSDLGAPAPAFAGEKHGTLPNIAALTARLGASWQFPLGAQHFDLAGSVTYVGHSRLGVGPNFDLKQGNYANTMLRLSAPIGRFDLSLEATNLLNARGNVFALGNPFGVTKGDQITPLRPRTIRLGAGVRF